MSAPATSPPRGRARLLAPARTRVGLVLVGLVLVTAVVGPWVAPHDIGAFVGSGLEPPSSRAPLGTDVLGRDVLSRLLNGGWSVVWMSLTAATLGSIGGTLVGTLSAAGPRRLGFVLMRLCDVLLALPALVFALVFVSLLGSSPWLIVALIAVAHLPQVARVAFASTREVVGREYVQWGRSVGLPIGRVVREDLLPGIAGPVLVDYGIRIVWSVGIVATLGVLGVGIQPPAADWGLMINDNRIGMAQQPLAVLAPLVCIAVFAIGVNLVVDGVSRTIARVRDGA